MKKSAKFVVDKELVNSRRYASTDVKFPILSVYVKREVADSVDEIAITIDTLSGGEDDAQQDKSLGVAAV